MILIQMVLRIVWWKYWRFVGDQLMYTALPLIPSIYVLYAYIDSY